MKYIIDNLIIDNLWVIGYIASFICIGIIIEATQKGMDNLSQTETRAFWISLIFVILSVVF